MGRTDVSSQDVLDLRLREATTDNEAARAVDGARRTQLGEHELDSVLWLTMHTLANVSDVAEDGLLVSFSHELRRRECVALAGRVKQGGIRCVQLGVETPEEL